MYNLGTDELLSSDYIHVAADINEALNFWKDNASHCTDNEVFLRMRSGGGPRVLKELGILTAEDVRKILRSIAERTLALSPSPKNEPFFTAILNFINERPRQRQENIFIVTLGLAPLYLIYYIHHEPNFSEDAKKELKNLLRTLLQMRILDRRLNTPRLGFLFVNLLAMFSAQDVWKVENRIEGNFTDPNFSLAFLREKTIADISGFSVDEDVTQISSASSFIEVEASSMDDLNSSTVAIFDRTVDEEVITATNSNISTKMHNAPEPEEREYLASENNDALNATASNVLNAFLLSIKETLSRHGELLPSIPSAEEIKLGVKALFPKNTFTDSDLNDAIINGDVVDVKQKVSTRNTSTAQRATMATPSKASTSKSAAPPIEDFEMMDFSPD